MKNILENLKEKGFKIEGEDKVIEYLNKYSELKPIFIELCNRAFEEFKNDSKLFIKIYIDPESGYKYLDILVRMKEYPDNIMDRIEEVRSKVRDKMPDSDGYVHLSTDFKYI